MPIFYFSKSFLISSITYSLNDLFSSNNLYLTCFSNSSSILTVVCLIFLTSLSLTS
nr:MAG TPA: hypothetical protein [Caudoviricetes sp.]DAV68465.1 MAG TPA: hypothetical protein [Caudoviricetes sp.]